MRTNGRIKKNFCVPEKKLLLQPKVINSQSELETNNPPTC